MKPSRIMRLEQMICSPITIELLFNIFPNETPLFNVLLTGKEIKSLIKYSENKKGTYHYLQYFNKDDTEISDTTPYPVLLEKMLVNGEHDENLSKLNTQNLFQKDDFLKNKIIEYLILINDNGIESKIKELDNIITSSNITC